MSFLDGVLNPILLPLLSLPPAFSIAIISFVLTLIITLVTKVATDQKRMKALKEELKEIQDKIKQLRDKPEKAMEKQKEAMGKNLEYMKHSMRATLFTLVPVIIVFGWLNAHIAYHPLVEGQPFNVTLILNEVPSLAPQVAAPQGITLLTGYPKWQEGSKVVVFSFTGRAGQYLAPPLRFSYRGSTCEVPVIIVKDASEKVYAPIRVECKGGTIVRGLLSNSPVHPWGGLSILGWKPGWFATYIFFSLLFSSLLRKLLRVY